MSATAKHNNDLIHSIADFDFEYFDRSVHKDVENCFKLRYRLSSKSKEYYESLKQSGMCCSVCGGRVKALVAPIYVETDRGIKYLIKDSYFTFNHNMINSLQCPNGSITTKSHGKRLTERPLPHITTDNLKSNDMFWNSFLNFLNVKLKNSFTLLNLEQSVGNWIVDNATGKEDIIITCGEIKEIALSRYISKYKEFINKAHNNEKYKFLATKMLKIIESCQTPRKLNDDNYLMESFSYITASLKYIYPWMNINRTDSSNLDKEKAFLIYLNSDKEAYKTHSFYTFNNYANNIKDKYFKLNKHIFNILNDKKKINENGNLIESILDTCENEWCHKPIVDLMAFSEYNNLDIFNIIEDYINSSYIFDSSLTNRKSYTGKLKNHLNSYFRIIRFKEHCKDEDLFINELHEYK